MYIAELPKKEQNEIKRELEKIGINGIDLQLAMNSKLSDIDYLLKKDLTNDYRIGIWGVKCGTK